MDVKYIFIECFDNEIKQKIKLIFLSLLKLILI